MADSQVDALVPEPHRDAVRRGLGELFGANVTGELTPLSGGRSGALVFRAQSGSRSAVLRIVVNPMPFNDPVRQFAMMATAAAEGVAPEVYFADPGAGVVITAHIPTLPLGPALRADHRLFASLGSTLRRLHAGPPGAPFLDVMSCIDDAVRIIRSADQQLPPLVVEYLERFAEIRSVLHPQMTLGASHNDLNPGNILFDGTRLWIIDWESAWQNDPMQDLATIRHWFRFPADAEALLLEAYFGGQPTAVQRAKLDLMQQVVPLNYALLFLLLTLQGGEGIPVLDPDRTTIPSFVETITQLGQGTLPLDTAAGKTHFALVMVNDAMAGLETARFRSALTTLQQG